MKRTAAALAITVLFILVVGRSAAQEPGAGAEAPAMTNQHLDQIIRRLDEGVQGRPGLWRLRIEGVQVTVITDENADRMRILVPVTEVDGLKQGELFRLLQANFDSALDARYAVAKDIVWSAYIHPLGSLGDKEFLSGLGQTVNLALTFRAGYSSGALVFRGGDSEELQRRELIDRLIEEGSAI